MQSVQAMTMAAGLALIILPTQKAQAEMYKWVDDQGHTIYSQHPPPEKGKAQVLKEAAPPPGVEEAVKAAEDKKKTKAKGEEKAKTIAEEEKKKKEENAAKEANCALGKDKLERVSNIPRVFTEDEGGARRKLTEEERQERITKAQAEIDKFCK
jgi:hypothetical protein